MPSGPRIPIPTDALRAFCTRWGVLEFALFGSVLRDDFGPESDVDVMIEFLPGRGFTFENTPEIIDELRALLGRRVDVVEKNRIQNPYRRASMMAGRQVVYAQAAA